MFSHTNSEQQTSCTMIKTFLKLAVPASITMLLDMAGFTVIPLIFAATLEDHINLAVVGLASTFSSIMVMSVLIGLNTAQDTLASQAFGAGNFRLCGLYLNRGHFIVVAFFIPLAVILCFFSEQILLLIGQDPKVSSLTATQICASLPGIFFACHYDL